MLISDDYRLLNFKLHDRHPAWGLTTITDVKLIQEMANRYDVISILDYGCGKGRLAKTLSGTGGDIRSYDPCVSEFSAPPERADLVVCTAVMEHVEPDCLEAVLDDIARLALKIVYFRITTIKSSYNLEDGSNAHLIVQPFEWWLPQLMARWNIRTVDVGDKNFIFVGMR